MARSRKAPLTLENLLFQTPEQKVLRLLLSEPTTTLTPRVISSRMKGVRGLGGTDGIMKILTDFQTLGLVDFVDNHRAVRVQDDNTCVHILKTFSAVCDLQDLRKLLEPVSSKGILYGNRATGKYTTDCAYDLFVVSDNPDEVKRVAGRHPLGKDLELEVWTPELYGDIEKDNPSLLGKLSFGIVLWGSTW